MPNPVVHFEIVGTDAAVLRRFYSEIFDWKIDADNSLNYGNVEAAPGGIGGGIAPSVDGSTRAGFYVAVEDPQATLDAVERLGGSTVLPPVEVPGGPTLAMFTDPDGNWVGLLKQSPR